MYLKKILQCCSMIAVAFVLIGQVTAEDKAVSALEKSCKYSFVDTPLRDVAFFLRDAYGVDVLLERVSYEGIKITYRASRDAKKQDSLKVAFEKMLGPHALAVAAKEGKLIVGPKPPPVKED